MSSGASGIGWRRDACTGAHRFSHEAMAAVFEIVVADADVRYAEQAAWEAFQLLDRIETELSRFMPGSDIWRVGRAPAGEWVRVGAAARACLELALRLNRETGGAFDVTAPGRPPGRGATDRVRGQPVLEVDSARSAVRACGGPVALDLGGIGKGFALERMAESLGAWDLDHVLLHSGGSTVVVVEPPAGLAGWPVTLADPFAPGHVLTTLELRREALSGSGLRRGPHIIDPRTGRPECRHRAAWARASIGAVADALSTAFMVMDAPAILECCRREPGRRALVVAESGAGRAGHAAAEPFAVDAFVAPRRAEGAQPG